MRKNYDQNTFDGISNGSKIYNLHNLTQFQYLENTQKHKNIHKKFICLNEKKNCCSNHAVTIQYLGSYNKKNQN